MIEFQGRVGLIGNPVEHSLSPTFQQAAFDALGINARYELWETTEDDIDLRLQELRDGRVFAANVTVPHKEMFYHQVDTCSEVAERAGAVNTLLARDGKIHGDNTDVHGFLYPLVERAFPFDESNAIILGAGGASRAVIVALLSAGIARLTIANRTVERAESLAREFGDERLSTTSLQQVRDPLPGCNLLVNATALGWHDESPVDSSLLATLPQEAIAYDLTYRDTPFLLAAVEAGLETLDGLPMLVHQGAKSFEIWTGLDAPVDVMMQAAQVERDRRATSGP